MCRAIMQWVVHQYRVRRAYAQYLSKESEAYDKLLKESTLLNAQWGKEITSVEFHKRHSAIEEQHEQAIHAAWLEYLNIVREKM